MSPALPALLALVATVAAVGSLVVAGRRVGSARIGGAERSSGVPDGGTSALDRSSADLGRAVDRQLDQ